MLNCILGRQAQNPASFRPEAASFDPERRFRIYAIRASNLYACGFIIAAPSSCANGYAGQVLGTKIYRLRAKSFKNYHYGNEHE